MRLAAERRETRCPCEGNREGNETGERRRNNSSVGGSVLGCDQGRAFGPGLAATVNRRKFRTRQDGRGCRVEGEWRAADCSESPYLLEMNGLGLGRFRLSIAIDVPRARTLRITIEMLDLS